MPQTMSKVDFGTGSEPGPFTIGEKEFILHGKPFVIRCGEIHFPRVPREYWRHRLKMCRALGLNAVCVYLFWNFHEWEEGVYDWNGQADAASFCRLAQEEGLWVILRPGPYSCAEWEMGGLPWWLTRHAGLGLRSTDPRFLEPATRYLSEVGRVLAPLQITQGGPILMAQVENEYGSFGADPLYIGALRDAMVTAGFEVPLFACNPAGDLANGHRDDLFQVVNFGVGATEASFKRLREFQPTGPLMNGEYYPAWFDMWGRRHRTGATEPIVKDLEKMLLDRRSFSIYMAHGGTSFGLWAGADRPFSPDTTSYDYDAPISEAGWTTPKFAAIRTVMSRHLQSDEMLPGAPELCPTVKISPFVLDETAPLFSNLPKPRVDDVPRSMEAYGQGRGAVIYRTTLPAGPGGTLRANAVHDFAWVFLDGVEVGKMDRRSRAYRLDLPARESPACLDLLVYAMGRVNFGEQIFDQKGLHAPVEFEGRVLAGWEIFNFALDETMLEGLKYNFGPASGPAFWRGGFALESVGDTFLDLRTWGKGVVWVNGHCLGRFWNIGPQQTLFVPGPWLQTGSNEIIVFDLLSPIEPRLEGLSEPILDQIRPELEFAGAKRAAGDFNPPAPVAIGAFTAKGGWQEVTFERPAKGRYLAFEACTSLDRGPAIAVSGLDAFDPNTRPISGKEWKLLWASSEETNYAAGEAEHALDGQTSTFWLSESGASALPPPHQIVIDLGDSTTLGGIRYLPRSGDETTLGRVRDFRVYVSDEPFGLHP